MRNLTFHHLHLLQRELPQELVFAGGVDHTGGGVSDGKVRQTGCDACVLTAGGGVTRKLRHHHCLPVLWKTCVFITYRLMELRRNEPDFLLRVVQMMRSLKRKSERSFLPPTVFYGEEGERKRRPCRWVKTLMICAGFLNFITSCPCCKGRRRLLPPPWPFPVSRTSSGGSESDTHRKTGD